MGYAVKLQNSKTPKISCYNSFYTNGLINGSTSKTFSISLLDYYVLSYCYQYGGSANSRDGLWSIELGTCRNIRNNYTSYVTLTRSGTTITVKVNNVGTGQYTSYSVAKVNITVS